MELTAICGTVFQISDEDFYAVSLIEWKVSYEDHRKYIKMRLKPSTRIHRFILGAKKGQIIDHINGDCLDNRRENLRICTDSENQCNRGMTLKNTVGFKGVTLRKDNGKYQAQIQKKHKNYYLGIFDTSVDAAKAYDIKAKELHGSFAKTNF